MMKNVASKSNLALVLKVILKFIGSIPFSAPCEENLISDSSIALMSNCTRIKNQYSLLFVCIIQMYLCTIVHMYVLKSVPIRYSLFIYCQSTVNLSITTKYLNYQKKVFCACTYDLWLFLLFSRRMRAIFIIWITWWLEIKCHGQYYC
jgi:hypothetical protein